MKLGGSARVPVSNDQGCHLSHAISRPSGDGKHGGMRLLVFENRRGSRTICPNAIQCSSGTEENRSGMRISRNSAALSR